MRVVARSLHQLSSGEIPRRCFTFSFASETIASFSFLASSAILAESASCSICFTTSSHTCTDIEEPPLNRALSSIHSPDGSLYAKMRQGSGSPFLAKANPDVCHLPRSLRGGFFSNRQNHALTAASPSLLRIPANPAANVVDVPVATLQEDSTRRDHEATLGLSQPAASIHGRVNVAACSARFQDYWLSGF